MLTRTRKPEIKVSYSQESGGYKLFLVFFDRKDAARALFELTPYHFGLKKDAVEYARTLAKRVGGRVLK